MSSSFFNAEAEISARISRAAHLLMCFDVQALFPGADKPAPFSRQLGALSMLPRVTVALLSGRSRAELQSQVGIPGLVYVGNLGLEISGDGFLYVESTAAGYSDALSQLGTRLAAKLEQIPGALVEDKGLTIRIAATGVPDTEVENVRRAIHETLAGADHPFRLDQRDNIYEIRPRVPWTKANAILWIKERHKQPEALVVFISDDEKDEETLAALPEAITVKVGGPTETLANYRLEGPADLRAFLAWLENVLRKRS